MKVTLIYPGFKGQEILLPLGILHVGSYLEQHGHDISYIDMRLDDYSEKDFEKTDIVGISCMTGNQIKYGLEISKFIRKCTKDIRIVWGGIHPTILPEETIQNKSVDIIIKHEGEIAFRDILDNIQKNKPISDVKGICTIIDNKIINNPCAEQLDLDELPNLNYHKLKNIKKYEPEKQFPYQLSRGCPGACTYCFNNREENEFKWRSKSAQKALSDIEYIKEKFNPETIYFVDDQSLVNKTIAREIAQGFINRKLNIKWFTSCTLNCFSTYDDETIKLMVKSGLYLIKFGAESGSPKILRRIKKAHNIKQYFNSLDFCEKYNIKAIVNFMMGFPDERQDDIHMTMDLIDTTLKNYKNAELKTIWRLTPFPGTEIYKEAVKLGYKVPSRFEEWQEYGYTTTEKLPWLSNRQFKQYEMINNITRHMIGPLEFPKKIRSIAKLFYDINARIRWKYKLFSLAPEWKFRSKMIQKIQGKGTV